MRCWHVAKTHQGRQRCIGACGDRSRRTGHPNLGTGTGAGRGGVARAGPLLVCIAVAADACRPRLELLHRRCDGYGQRGRLSCRGAGCTLAHGQGRRAHGLHCRHGRSGPAADAARPHPRGNRTLRIARGIGCDQRRHLREWRADGRAAEPARPTRQRHQPRSGAGSLLRGHRLGHRGQRADRGATRYARDALGVGMAGARHGVARRRRSDGLALAPDATTAGARRRQGPASIRGPSPSRWPRTSCSGWATSDT